MKFFCKQISFAGKLNLFRESISRPFFPGIYLIAKHFAAIGDYAGILCFINLPPLSTTLIFVVGGIYWVFERDERV